MVAFTGPQNHLRAKGNLDFLQFIRLVKHYWGEAHPDIPIIPTGGDKPAKYPCILYGLEVRQTVSGESKAKHRERIGNTIVTAQKFDNMVSFSATAEHDPELCEEIIEEFENWMLEMVPVFKELGISEMTYGRRLPDSEVSRRGFGVSARAVVFHVRTEKVRATNYKALQSIVVDARTRFLPSDEDHSSGNAYNSITPRYHGKIPTFAIETFDNWPEEDLDNKPDPILSIPQTNFMPGDIIYLAPRAGSFKPGFYEIFNVSGQAFADDRYYELLDKSKREQDIVPPILDLVGTGTGRVFYSPDIYRDDIETIITDEYKTVVPEQNT